MPGSPASTGLVGGRLALLQKGPGGPGRFRSELIEFGEPQRGKDNPSQVAGAYALSAEVLDEVGIGQDLPGQLLLLLCGLEDQAPLAEPHDVLLH